MVNISDVIGTRSNVKEVRAKELSPRLVEFEKEQCELLADKILTFINQAELVDTSKTEQRLQGMLNAQIVVSMLETSRFSYEGDPISLREFADEIGQVALRSAYKVTNESFDDDHKYKAALNKTIGYVYGVVEAELDRQKSSSPLSNATFS